MNSIEIEKINKRVKNKHILKNVELSIPQGEIIGVLGPNGAGKTTLFKCILNLNHFEGSIKLLGIDNHEKPAEAIKKVGAIIEEPCFYSNFSGYKNMVIAAQYYNCVDKNKIDNLVDSFSMGSYIKNKVKTYSLGMKQRLAIAMALVHSPDIVILDEPMNGLDPEGIYDLRKMLRQICEKEHKTIIVSSHILSEMELLCDKVVFIKSGEIIGMETVNDYLEERYLELMGNHTFPVN